MRSDRSLGWWINKSRIELSTATDTVGVPGVGAARIRSATLVSTNPASNSEVTFGSIVWCGLISFG